MEREPPVHLIHQFLLGQVAHRADEPLDLFPMVAVQIFGREIGRRGVGQRFNPDDIEVSAPWV